MKIQAGMKCPVCEKGVMIEVIEDFSAKGITLHGIEKLRCDVCNETFISPKDNERVERILASFRRTFPERFGPHLKFTSAEKWEEGRKNARTVEEKEKFNVWDNFRDDVLPVFKAIQEGRWSWHRNPACKYVELRVDMRSGHVIIRDRDGKRINPEDLAYQYSRFEPCS